MKRFTLLSAFVFVLGPASHLIAQDNEFESLFDGKSLSQWRGYQKEEIGKGWTVEDDAIKFDGSSGNGDIITKKTYENFELQLEWNITKGGNSGIMYMVQMGDSAPYMSGPEYQILHNEGHGDGKNPKTSAGSLYALYAGEGAETKPLGEWNITKIVINNGKVEHWLNGKKVVEAEIGSDEWNERIDNSKFKTWEKFAKKSDGHIALQDHGDEVWFRNIKIKEL
jgi:hypothetical protein